MKQPSQSARSSISARLFVLPSTMVSVARPSASAAVGATIVLLASSGAEVPVRGSRM